MDIVVITFLSGIAVYLVWHITRKEKGTSGMIKIHDAIREGAIAFLRRQYKTIPIFIIAITAVLGIVFGLLTAISFATGAVLSALAGYLGMLLAGLGLLSVGLLYHASEGQPSRIVAIIFGASLTALFGGIGGGVYAKAADMGADLVGKLEMRIPEDDPYNPTTDRRPSRRQCR